MAALLLKQSPSHLIKNVLRGVTPPFLWKAISAARRSALRRKTPKWEHGAEQPPEFYDWNFAKNKSWRQHYTESYYYPLWTIVADRIKRAGALSILDIGCGPGQVASFLFDKGIPRYLGLDFSPARIEQARIVCPKFEFAVADVFATDLLNGREYDCVLLMEFLEHVENELEVLRRLKSNTRVIATVPNFPATGHVRFFKDAASVNARYRQYFRELNIEEHLPDNKGKRFFLIEGFTP